MSGGYVEIGPDLTLYYETAGSGDRVILLIPGWTMSTRVFERQLAAFESSAEFRFVTLDPRAQGQSTKTAGGHYYEQHGRDLQLFIDALQLDNIVLGGWSFGTFAALAYVDQFGSDRLNGLIMLDGPPRAAAEDNRQDWVTYRYDDADGQQSFYTLDRLRRPETANREFAEWMLEAPGEAGIEWLLEITRQMPDEAAALLNATSVYLDYRETLIALHQRIPLWYMVRADQEGIVSDWARAHTPAARVDAFGEHLMFWERAEQFNRALIEFVQDCGSSAQQPRSGTDH